MVNLRRFRILRSVKLVPAAMISAIVLAVMSLLGLLNFDVGTPSLSVDGVTSDVPPESPKQKSPEEKLSEEKLSEPEPREQERLTAAEVPDGGDEGAAADGTESSPEPMNPARTVDVLIDGEEYLVELHGSDGDSTREARSLSEIVEMARASSGDAAGIRVRISRRFNAVQRADRALRDALSEAGLGHDEIDHRRTLVD